MLQRGGWMIAAGPKVGDVVYNTLALPVHEQGGPIKALTARPIRPFTLRVPLWKFIFQAFNEDLLGLMDSSQKPVKSLFEKLGKEVLNGAPVFPLSAQGRRGQALEGSRLVSDAGLPVLGNNWEKIRREAVLGGADMEEDCDPDLLLQPPRSFVPSTVHLLTRTQLRELPLPPRRRHRNTGFLLAGIGLAFFLGFLALDSESLEEDDCLCATHSPKDAC
jgi:hypothetical protein